jgi:hypothetical protein
MPSGLAAASDAPAEPAATEAAATEAAIGESAATEPSGPSTRVEVAPALTAEASPEGAAVERRTTI